MLNHLYKIEIEESVLSSFIFDNDELFKNEFNDSMFTDNRIIIFNAIKEIVNTGNVADIVTITNKLSGIIKATDIVNISDSPVSMNLKYHLSELEKARLRREMSSAYTVALEMCKNGSEPSEIDLAVKGKISNIEIHEPVKAIDLTLSTISEIEKESRQTFSDGLQTGITALDRVMNGFQLGEFIVIAARPGMGKTSLALNMARNFGFYGDSGIFFSLEMMNNQLMRRMICDVGSIDGKYLFQNQLKFGKNKDIWSRINQASSTIGEMPIKFDDSVPMTMDKIYSRAKKAKALSNIKYIVIDHLGLIAGWNKEGQGPKAEITAMLKTMAKELQIVVIVLSQLNREIEKRSTRNPKMSDLRDAGSIEQDCDVALFPDVPEKFEGGTTDEGFELAEIYVVKTRRGRTGKVTKIKWQGHYFRYSDNLNAQQY